MTVDFADLSADDQKALILCGSRTVDVGVEILNADLSVKGDISDRLDVSSSTVQWDGPSTVHRGCTLTLALADDDLDWSVDLVRLSMTLSDDVTGLSGKAFVGVFALTQPDKTTGTVIEDKSSQIYGLTAYTVNGQDVTSLLDRQIGYSLVESMLDGDDVAVPVLTAAAAITTAAGFPTGTTVLIDSTGAASTLPQDMTWPLIAPTDTSATDTSAAPALPKDAPADSPGPTTWRTAENDTLGLINYRAVWADSAGFLRFTPYVDPSATAPSFTFDADDELVAAVGPARTQSLNVSAFNSWTFIWSNMPDDESGNPVVASSTNGGIIALTNDTEGPSSITARGGTPRGVYPTQVQITAASVDDFTAQADAQVKAAKAVVTTYKVTTVTYPLAGHYDVFLYVDAETVAGGSAKVQATSWSLPLSGEPMTWTWQRVS